MPVVSTEGIQTSGIATSLTVIATSTNGGFSKTDQDAKPKDAPADPSENAAPQTLENDSEASTDIFGTALPLEGKVSQGGLQQISSPTLSTSGTAPHLAAEISRKFEGKSAQFDISLTPEGLGKVDVKITINARGEVSAAMKFDNPQAAAELKGRAAELQQALEQSGFSISRDGISFTDQQGRGFGAPQQQANQQDWQEAARRTAKSRVFQDISDLAEASALKVAEASSAYSRRSSTGVDVRI
jgi:Meckel syndrome type 1 protein